MNWKDYIERLKHSDDVLYTLHSAANNESIAKLEQFFHLTLPEEIKQLYLQADGIAIELAELAIAGIIGHLVFPLQEAKDYNQMLRKGDKKLKQYFFISDSGFGDYFGYHIQNQQITKTDIFVWNHEENTIAWVAPSISIFIEEWTRGKINL